MEDRTRKRRLWRIVTRVLTFGFVGEYLEGGVSAEPPTLYEQLDDLMAVVAEQESRWRRDLGSRRR